MALLGPRQVGKTTLAHSLADELGEQALYLDLELPSDRAKLTDAELYLSQHEERLVILDEIHRVPGIFETLRSLIDQRRRKGKRNCHFLLLGSASIDLLQQSAETLAGRIAYEELTPFSVREVAGLGSARLTSSGCAAASPTAFLPANDEDSFTWRSAFIQTYLERDVPALGPRIPAETLRRYWQMLAHNQGQMLNAAQLARRPRRKWAYGRPLPRHHGGLVACSPFAAVVHECKEAAGSYTQSLCAGHRIAARSARHSRSGRVAGASSCWRKLGRHAHREHLDALPATTRPTFYRTSAGAEIDLVIELSAKERWAIEVKRSLGNPSPSKGFYIGCEDIRATRRIVLYPGDEHFKLDAKTEVMPLEIFLKSEFGPLPSANGT